MPVGTVAAVGALADIIFSGLSQISYQWASIKGVAPIFDKYNTLTPEQFEAELPQTSNQAGYRLTDVTITYDDTPILSNLSFTIEANKKYLLVGRSGIGKSSVFNIMIGYSTQYTGTITLNGIDIHKLSSKQIADHVLYIPQVPYIFTGTVRDNLLLGEQYPDNNLINVLKQVGVSNADEFINSNVGYQGDALSGGQKQRLTLARALLRKPHILLVDEITSSLDRMSAVHIEQLLLNLPNTTVVFITHAIHPETQHQFNQIISLEKEEASV